ncbi:MAG: NAD-dependent epimerase/dehydratase family protein [Kiritimatiellia bacterium]
MILLTGSSGFVGTHLRVAFVTAGIPFLTVGRNGDYSWDKLETLPWATIDAIVHLAGLAHDTHNRTNAQAYFDINTGLTQRLVQAAIAHSFKGSFIFFSSVKACADSVDNLLSETTPCHPQTPYGESKLAAEKVLLQQPFRTLLLRPSMIYGSGNRGNLSLLMAIARRGLPWPLAAFQNERSFCAIGNVTATVLALLDHPPESGIYQLADDRFLSTNQVYAYLCSGFGRPCRLWKVSPRLISFLARLGDLLPLPLNTERLHKLTENYRVDNHRLKLALGWTQMPVNSESGFAELMTGQRP